MLLMGVGLGFFGTADIVDVVGNTGDVRGVESGISVGGINVVFGLLVSVVILELSGTMVVGMVPATSIEIVASILPATFFALQL